MPNRHESPFLKQAADEIRSMAEHEPALADELRELANDFDAEADREIQAELRRRDFSLSTRSLSARLATGS
jgi:hypothetical protein